MRRKIYVNSTNINICALSFVEKITGKHAHLFKCSCASDAVKGNTGVRSATVLLRRKKIAETA